MITLDDGEILGLYSLLKNLDNDEVFSGLVQKMEPYVFARLSLEEIENIDEIYKEDPYCLRKREIS